MTPGHKHRTLHVKRGGLIHSLLTYPLITSTDYERVDASPYPWGPISTGAYGWYLSGLSILHRWFGLTLWVPGEDE